VFTEQTNLVVRFLRIENRQLCPEYGANMTLVDYRREHGVFLCGTAAQETAAVVSGSRE